MRSGRRGVTRAHNVRPYMGRAAGLICGCPRGARRFCLPCQREVAERSEAGGIALWQLPFERGAVTEGLPYGGLPFEKSGVPEGVPYGGLPFEKSGVPEGVPYGGLPLLSGGISRQGNPPISALAPL